ncbi:MAG TPA: MFS transporter [Pyrinomonadaceae bacterium]|nr:MFS transporter [Pyrinomonadaceae bacterium]
MLNHQTASPSLRSSRTTQSLLHFTLVLLAIEFLDELVFGAREASWPLIRDDLHLSYTQIGMLLSVPHFISILVEPLLGILADVWNRRALVLCGGAAFAVALLLVALSHSFTLLLVAFIILYPASGAFVSLSQATLMDADPRRHEQNMARWALAGSLGVVCGPMALAAVIALGIAWQAVFVALAGFALLLVAIAWRFHFTRPSKDVEQAQGHGMMDGVRGAFRALKRREVLRWLILLELADLLLDGLYGFLALYFVDVVGATQVQAGLAIAIWTGVGLPGDLLLIPLLERVRGLRYLRWSTLVALFLFPAFLLTPNFTLKVVMLGLLGLTNAGWYSILQAQLYSVMPGQSGTVMALGSVFGLVGGLIPLGIGILAEQYGLGVSSWLLVLGPVALMFAIPKESE